jgi:hypothetical protein
MERNYAFFPIAFLGDAAQVFLNQFTEYRHLVVVNLYQDFEGLSAKSKQVRNSQLLNRPPVIGSQFADIQFVIVNVRL